MQIEKPFNYELKYGGVTYAHAGNAQDAQWIELRPPTSRNTTECAFLKQAVYRSFPEPSKEDAEKAAAKSTGDLEVEITGEEILLILYRSKEVELSKVLVTARELFSTKGVAFVDGEEHATKKILDDMHPQDFENMVGEYIANFIMASAFQRTKKS